MRIKQNKVWEFIRKGIQWKQNGVWRQNCVSKPDVTKYVLATDDDFSGETNGRFRYIGTDEYVEIPHVIKGVNVTSYGDMFRGTSVKGVKSTNKNVTDIASVFRDSQATSLDLSSFDTSGVKNMGAMFYGAQATTLDLSSFDTSSVTSMGYMFYNSQAKELDLSSFDTSNVTYMRHMISGSQATSLNLSSFDTSNVIDMSNMFERIPATKLDLNSFDTSGVRYMGDMFQDSQATIGYARTQADADRFNGTSNIPVGLTFVVKD